MRKKIAFISPIGEGGPKTLYRDLVKGLSERYPAYEYFLVSSTKEWIGLHFSNEKYDLIVSSIPFFWKPPNCKYVMHQHGLYKNDRGFTSITRMLARLYPYNNFFATMLVYPSKFLKNYYNSSNKKQKVIYNFSSLPIADHSSKSFIDKEEYIFTTITNFHFYNKARGIIDIVTKISKLKIQKNIKYYVCGSGKYNTYIKTIVEKIKIPNNIKIIFLGEINHSDIIVQLEKTDIFLYATFQDTFAISVLEAMSFGIPIILNDYELFYELYNAEFVAKDAQSLNEKIKALINNELYYTSYIQNIRKNISKFSEKKILQEWAISLESLI